jgi:uncharacterized protein YbjT (DUF2867 family)
MINRRMFTVLAGVSLFAHCGNVTINTSARAQEGPAKAAPALPSMAGERVLVAGATGRTGRLIVGLLKDQGAKVRGFSRNVKTAKAEIDDVEWIAADVRDARSLKDIAKGVDRVVIALGSNSFRDKDNKPELVDNKGVALLVDEAKKAGVKSFVLISSVSATDTEIRPGMTDFQKLMRNVMANKLAGENYLRASGLNYTVLRPVGLWDRDPGKFPIGIMHGDVEVPGMITRGDVAAVAVNALVNPDAAGKTVTIFNVTHPQLEGWKSAWAQIPGDK